MDTSSFQSAKGARSPGFTLVEVTISMAVLAFVLLGFMSIMSSSAALSMSSKEAMIAAFELQSAVEDLYGIDYVNEFVKHGPRSVATTPPQGPAPGDFPPVMMKTPYNLHVSSPQGTPVAPGTRYSALNNELITFQWTQIDSGNPGISGPAWVEFEVDISWTNYKGVTQTDSITARRSR